LRGTSAASRARTDGIRICGAIESNRAGQLGDVVATMFIKKQLRRYIPSSDDFDYSEFPFYWLAQVQGAYQHHLEKALDKVGADIPSWRILLFLKVHGSTRSTSISDISTHAIIKVSTMTRIIQRMKADGWVETNVHAEDGRVKEVVLTPAGREKVIQIERTTEKLFARSFKDLTQPQISRLNKTLKQLYQNLAED
jgi:MarR family transcriptional regulator, organic hydroperoxide resistance regulator